MFATAINCEDANTDSHLANKTDSAGLPLFTRFGAKTNDLTATPRIFKSVAIVNLKLQSVVSYKQAIFSSNDTQFLVFFKILKSFV